MCQTKTSFLWFLGASVYGVFIASVHFLPSKVCFQSVIECYINVGAIRQVAPFREHDTQFRRGEVGHQQETAAGTPVRCNSCGMLYNPVARLFSSFTTVASSRKCRLSLPTQAAETRRYTGMSLDVNKKHSRERRVVNTEHHNQAPLSRVEMKLAKFARGIHLHRCSIRRIMSAMFTKY